MGTSYLTPSVSGSQEELLLIREALELGALYSIQSKDTPAFERFMAQLKVYYNPSNFGQVTVPVSQRMASLLGLNLLRLLTQNKIAEFHTELELLPASLLETVYIQHPMQIEQSLMEGAFNKVWHSRANVPAKEYLYFIDILMGTIR